jgi:hypothetical protein
VVEYKCHIPASESKSSRTRHVLCGFHHSANIAPCSSPSAKLDKMPIRPGPLAFFYPLELTFWSFLGTSQWCMYVPHSLLACKSPNNGADIPFIHCCTLGLGMVIPPPPPPSQSAGFGGWFSTWWSKIRQINTPWRPAIASRHF